MFVEMFGNHKLEGGPLKVEKGVENKSLDTELQGNLKTRGI